MIDPTKIPSVSTPDLVGSLAPSAAPKADGSFAKAVSDAASAQAAAETPTEAAMFAAAQAFQASLSAKNLSLEFSVQNGQQITIKVVDQQTKQVVREIPPGRLVQAASSGDAGLLLDHVG